MSPTSVTTGVEPRRHIAVIAVHGVGDQQPLDSARAIGDLLQVLDADEAPGERPPCTPSGPVDPVYDPFTERKIRIAVRPVVVTAGATPEAGIQGPFHAYASLARQKGVERGGRGDDEDEIVGFQFMRGQLRCYEGEDPEDTYDTVRLEGTRRTGKAKTVHVYELHWADLSRLKAGLLSIFTELYQVLFHLSSLGTHAIDAEAIRQRDTIWQALRRYQGWASVALTTPIPILNLFMLGTTAMVAAMAALQRLAPEWQLTAAVAAGAGLLAAGAGAFMWRQKRPAVWLWLSPVVGWLAVSAAAFGVGRAQCGGRDALASGGCAAALIGARVIGNLCLLAAAAGAIVWLLSQYDRRRPGVLRWTKWMAAVTGPLVAATAWAKAPAGPAPGRFISAWITAFEVQYLLLFAAWTVFYAVALMAAFVGWRAVQTALDPRTARASVATGRLTLSIPAFSFAAITLTGWGLIALAVRPLLTGLPFTPLFESAGTTVETLIDSLQQRTIYIALPVLLAFGGVSLLPAIWGLGPVVWSEWRPPSRAKATRGDYSNRLGEWLDRTFQGISVSGVILYIAVMLAVPAAVALAIAGRMTEFTALLKGFQTLGTLSGVALVWLFSVRGSLKNFALGFRPALDLILDVDNWLREHPLDDNPRAKICGRYVSLLRYICDWRDPRTNQPYAALVIIAHSQGTVITADLLRFFQWEASKCGGMENYDKGLARLKWTERRPDATDQSVLPITLFTMGCPLRQLYGWRFPRLYGWARHGDETKMDKWASNDLARPGGAPRPDPRKLGVRLWVNAFRSGDYVGRYLWRNANCRYVWTSDRRGSPVTAPVESNSADGDLRLEFCIGAGAHTHYWDGTAQTIGGELDRLIEGA